MCLHDAPSVAARDCDVGRSLAPVRVLYRTRSGATAALQDARAHRKLPLSVGRLTGCGVDAASAVVSARSSLELMARAF